MTTPHTAGHGPDTLPQPEKRRGFTPRQVAAVFIKCEGRCASCGVKVQLDGYQIDHIQRLDALGKHELENWQLLCTPCHTDKTRVDNREAKKGARIRRKADPETRKPPTMRGRSSFPTSDQKEKRGSWGKRGFQGSRKFNGEVTWKTR